MKQVKVEDAIGMVLGHDLTKIVPGEFKGAAFKKGHVIRKEDLPMLKSMGKNHINVLEISEGELHENEAAQRIVQAVAGEGLYYGDPREGKIELRAKNRGIVKVNIEALKEINSIDQIILATLHDNTLIEKDQSVGATRTIPLVIKEDKIVKVEEIGKLNNQNIISIKPLKDLKIGIVVTGTEVFEGVIKDKFAPVLTDKIKYYGSTLIDLIYAPDNREVIKTEIEKLIKKGAEVVLVSGGMSVDADDVTPLAIEDAATEVTSYGVPALPGNMLMIAYSGDCTIFGIPGAAMYFETTTLDILLPRVLAGERIKREEIVELGHGGYCPMCKECTYPNCHFGK
ncbi:molybdopterin-binding protein [Clostridium peptidivorans]|uniref:molybdopterin-binding protein n=1 Tax=Clostridium peptidivorans TaxID=100174 RepID=UPI000BE45E8D|nr:molybdopterin-binding protein [Clostridium peptidivorans]